MKYLKDDNYDFVLLSPQETLLGCISKMLMNITKSTKMLENGG